MKKNESKRKKMYTFKKANEQAHALLLFKQNQIKAKE